MSNLKTGWKQRHRVVKMEDRGGEYFSGLFFMNYVEERPWRPIQSHKMEERKK